MLATGGAKNMIPSSIHFCKVDAKHLVAGSPLEPILSNK